jgi:carboxyl-terminal processing protease
LCETVDRILEQHYQPPAMAAMAAGALEGVLAAQPTLGGEAPGRLTCAVPAPDFNPTCEAIDRKIHDELAPLDEMVTAAVDGVLSILDPYNIYLPPSIADAIGDDGVVPGVGVIIGAVNAAGSPCVRVAPSCPLTVATVVAGSAASDGGLLAGDVVVAIDGQAVDGMAVSEAAALLAGEPGSEVELSLADRDVTLVRVDQQQAAVSADLFGSTGYVRLSYFAAETHLLLHSYLIALFDAGADRIVLDLRDNPGGYLFSASLVGSEFLASGDLYLTQERTGNFRFPAVEGGIATRTPLVVVVNEQTASAAEILAAALQERNRATIVGTPTFGKNLVQLPFELRNGGVLRLTIATWTTPQGTSVAGTGVVPDVALELDPSAIPETVVEAVLAVS